MNRTPDPRRLAMRGRNSEVESLGELVRGAASGIGTIAIIEGQAGIGKTRLVDELESIASAHDIEVARAPARELETDRPFGILVDALKIDWAKEQLLESISPHGGSGHSEFSDLEQAMFRYQAIDVLADAVETRAASGPLLMILEDVHWSDPGTHIALNRLVSVVQQLPVALVCTTRPTPRPPGLAAFIAEAAAGGAEMLRLPPLQEEDLFELAEEFLSAKPGPSFERSLTGTGGNPLFASELLAALLQEELIEIVDGVAELKEFSLPRTVQIAVLRRLAFLHRAALEALKLASVFGTKFSISQLSALAGEDDVALIQRLDEPLRAGLIMDDGKELAFRHDVVREAIYLEMPQAIRKSLHRRAADVLVAAGASRLDAASHIVVAGEQGDSESIKWLADAGREAVATSPAVAVELLQKACDLCAPGDPLLVGLMGDLILPLMWAGRLADAEGRARAVLEQPHDRALEVSVRAQLGQCLELQGNATAAIEQLEIAATVADDQGPEQARLLAMKAYVMRTDHEPALELAARSLEMAERFGDEGARVIALMAQCWHLSGHDLKNSIERGRMAVGTAMTCGDIHALRWNPHRQLAASLVNAGLLGEASDVVARGLALGEAVGTYWHIPFFHLLSGSIHYFAGRWGDAIAELETSLQQVGESSYIDTELVAARLTLIHALRGDLDEARALLPRAVGQEASPQMLAEAVLAEAQGDLDLAADRIKAFMDSSTPISYVNNGALLTRICLDAGDTAAAERYVGTVEAAASRMRFDRILGVADNCRGLLDRDADALLRSVASLRTTPCKLELAWACADAGNLLVESGRAGEAVDLLEEAAAIFDGAGAARQIARVDYALRQAGVRRGARGLRKRPRTGWASITDTEKKVLEFVLDGLTNREIAERLFVSKRTVETHVSHLLQKLGVRRRTELLAKAREKPM